MSKEIPDLERLFRVLPHLSKAARELMKDEETTPESTPEPAQTEPEVRSVPGVRIKVRQMSLMPTQGTAGSAAYDLRADLKGNMIKSPLRIAAGERVLVKTGVSIALPEGKAAFVLPRSGSAVSSGLTVLNAPGLIDTDYRGEIGVILINHGDRDVLIEHGSRIAQLMLVDAQVFEFFHVDSFDKTERGEGGFGSTGLS